MVMQLFFDYITMPYLSESMPQLSTALSKVN